MVLNRVNGTWLHTSDLYLARSKRPPATFQHYKRQGVPCLEAPVLLSAFIHQADCFFAMADLMSPFLLPQLLNFFLQNVGYILTITTQILLSPLLLQNYFPSGLFGESEAVSHKLLSHFPLAPISLSYLRPLLSWLAITPPIHTHKVLKSREHVPFFIGGFEQIT